MDEHVRLLRQVLLERPVDLDGVYKVNSLGEKARQDAAARPDLEHDVARRELGEPLDHAQDVLVDEEVLPKLLLGSQGHKPKQRAAFASICAASSAASALRARAKATTMCTTFAGSFGRPRRGSGARYGESVSTSSRSAGTAYAAERRSCAFLYVTLPANEMYQPRSSAGSSSAGDEKQWRTTVPVKPASPPSVSSSAARVWMTTGLPRSAATPSWRSNRRRCASRGA